MKGIKKTKEKEICEICGKELGKEDTNEFRGKILCKHCLDNEPSICESCNTRIWIDDSHGDEYVVLCKSCYDSYYTRCERCDCLIHRDDANYFNGSDLPYCNECFDETVYKLIATHLGINSNEKMRFLEVKDSCFKYWLHTYENKDLKNIQLWLIKTELVQAVGRARLLRYDCTVKLYASIPLEQAIIE